MEIGIETSKLTQDWLDWIQVNINRGCTPESMIEQMVRQNFDPLFAKEAVYHGINNKIPMAPSVNAERIFSLEKPLYVHENPRLPQAGNIIKTDDRDVKVLCRLSRPVVALFDELLSAEECDELIRQAKVKLKRSTTVDPQTGAEMVIKDRSSYGAFFSLGENEFVLKLERRISKVMNWPVECGEGLQVLNYGVGGEYKPHFDFFPTKDPGSQPHLAKGGQRVSTLIMYLNNVDEAGETIFPDIGFSVVPKKGAAVYFEYCNSQGQTDALTLHGGAPVASGEKWVATKWMRQNEYK